MKKSIKTILNSFRNMFSAVVAASLLFLSFGCNENSGNDFPSTYAIAIMKAINGTVSASAGSAAAGETITLTISPESGFGLYTLEVLDEKGNAVATTEVTAGEKYTFTMPSGRVVVFATFEDITYRYNIRVSESENGTVSASASSAVAGETITLTIPPESGYIFGTLEVLDEKGNAVATTEVTAGEKFTFKMPPSDVTVYASFSFAVVHYVTFNTDGGSAVANQIIASGSRATKPDEPTKNGYEFLGWYDGTTAFDFTTPVTNDLTLTAKWREVLVKVTGATFDGTKTLTPTSSVFIAGRSITIGDLYVSDHEVTQKEYETYCAYSDRNRLQYGEGSDYPVYCVNWYDAIVYCNLRSIDEGFSPAYSISGETDPSKWDGCISQTSNNGTKKYRGPSYNNPTWNNVTFNKDSDGYRLPTQAEWEYIARGGRNWDNFTYSGSNDIEDVAWYKIGDRSSLAHKVKQKAANSLGIYDMSGNVWEWCYDWNSDSITADTPPSGPESGSKRVLRGGGFNDNYTFCKVSVRDSREPNKFNNENNANGSIPQCGFRVVRNAK